MLHVLLCFVLMYVVHVQVKFCCLWLKNQMNPEATQEFQRLSEAYRAIMSHGIMFIYGYLVLQKVNPNVVICRSQFLSLYVTVVAV